MAEPNDESAILDRLFQARSEGDLAAARACCTSDAVFWHGYDRLEMTLDQISETWRDLMEGFVERRFVNLRRDRFHTGFVERLEIHVSTGEQRLGWHSAVFVELEDGLISRFDEYIDRAGYFVPPPLHDDPQPDAQPMA